MLALRVTARGPVYFDAHRIQLTWFCVTTLRDWLKNFPPLFYPIRGKTKTNRDSLAHVFPRFASATCICFDFWLVLCIACVLHLNRAITLVLVLRHSNKTRPNTSLMLFGLTFSRWTLQKKVETQWIKRCSVWKKEVTLKNDGGACVFLALLRDKEWKYDKEVTHLNPRQRKRKRGRP